MHIHLMLRLSLMTQRANRPPEPGVRILEVYR